ncbi:hypothetical protein ABTX81_30225 [Kitasatospora sp. NPDC097605]|uniref:hypothetical protein n=1 Tax=Kitasatospora sp. NPDC097605 TaxID=3157226 RepID=UPI0033168063
MLPLPDHVTAALTSRDPLRVYRAAEDAQEYLADYLDSIKATAAGTLVTAHGGNKSAAARELGFNSPQAFAAWFNRRGERTGAAEAAPHAPEQPALYFRNPDEARDALGDWFLEQQSVTDRLEPLVLGALAVGLTPEEVYRLSGIPLTTVKRMRPAKIEVAADLGGLEAMTVLDETARALTAHALALAEAARADDQDESLLRSPASCGAHIWSVAARAFVHQLAPAALVPAETPEVRALRKAFQNQIAAQDAAMAAAHPNATDEELQELLHDAEPPAELLAAQKAYDTAYRELVGEDDDDSAPTTLLDPDVWLAAQISQFNREAATLRHPDRYLSDERDGARLDAMAGAYEQLAAAYLHLRATGTVPPLTTPGNPR